MFTFNPLDNSEALWQYAVMILISAVFGYIIGFVGIKQSAYRLERKLAGLDAELETYMMRKALLHKTAHVSTDDLPENNSLNPVAEVKPDDLKIAEEADPN